MAPWVPESTGRRRGLPTASAVEIEVARRALLEPETVVIGGVLEELGGFLEHVLVVGGFGGPGRVVARMLGLVLLGGGALGVVLRGRRDVDRAHDLGAMRIVLGGRLVLDARPAPGARLVLSGGRFLGEGLQVRRDGLGLLVRRLVLVELRARRRVLRLRVVRGFLGKIAGDALVGLIASGPRSRIVLQLGRPGGLLLVGHAVAADRPERLSFGALDLGRIGAAPALEIA